MGAQQKTLKILTIDGGGIKGLYSASILQELEEKFGGHLSDYFDMICGTSTGGLIALGLSLKISAKDLVEFYTTKGPKIFSKRRKNPFLWLYRVLRQSLFFGKFCDKELKLALTEVFGERLIGESENLLCIPSYMITEAKPRVFKKNYADLDTDDQARYVDVALATSAAPTYFPIAEIPSFAHTQFIDGGIWANNPTMVGYVEALTRLVGEDKKGYDSISILSIASLSFTERRPIGIRRHRSFIGWKNSLFDAIMNGQSMFIDYFFTKDLQRICPVPINYVRIPSAEVGTKQEKDVQLDVATRSALRLMTVKGRLQGNTYKKKAEVEAFFRTKKTYNKETFNN